MTSLHSPPPTDPAWLAFELAFRAESTLVLLEAGGGGDVHTGVSYMLQGLARDARALGEALDNDKMTADPTGGAA